MSTATERLLAKLTRKSFLRMWSHASPHRDQKDHGGQGKELCDLLAVLDNDVFIFSDKECVFKADKPLDLTWKRWHRAAVEGAIDQIRGAERWLKQYPTRVFVDSQCSVALPVDLPDANKAVYHRIVVAHGAGEACRTFYGGGSGALLLNTTVMGSPSSRPADEVFPFVIGQVAPDFGFVHVLDEATLEVVLSTLDTPVEFRDYLRFKEDHVASNKHIIASGEEDLLGAYLALGDPSRANAHGLGDLTGIGVAVIEDGTWDAYQCHPGKIARDRANRDSYLWDGLIERFAKHAIEGTQYFSSPGGVKQTERVLRILCAEPRAVRRTLIAEVLRQVARVRQRPYKVWFARGRPASSVCYVFVLLRQQPDQSDSGYRSERLAFVHMCASIARLQQPDCRAHIGIGFDPPDSHGGSEDIVLIDDSVWNEALAERARKFQAETGVLTEMRTFHGTVREYPERDPTDKPKGVERNSRCPCGSGRKWKKCCARPT